MTIWGAFSPPRKTGRGGGMGRGELLKAQDIALVGAKTVSPLWRAIFKNY
jgi:hypothetical protein